MTHFRRQGNVTSIVILLFFQGGALPLESNKQTRGAKCDVVNPPSFRVPRNFTINVCIPAFPAGARCSSADAAGGARVRHSDRGEAVRAPLADVFPAGGPASPVAHIKRQGKEVSDVPPFNTDPAYTQIKE